MKRIFTFLVLLLAAIAVNAAQYSLNVKGVTITDNNKSDILGDGKVKFDDTTNTLTFTDADITYTEYVVGVMSTWKESINIKFEGKNTFTTTGKNSCIYLACKQQEVKLWSDEYTMGSLTINVTDEVDGRQGIENMGHNNITMLRLDLNINVPKTDGIGPLNGSATVERLTIDKCNVAIKAGRAALKFKEVQLIDSHYQEGYAINGEKTSGCTYNGTVMKEVRVDEDVYGLWVAGTKVHSKIMHNILIDEAPAYTAFFVPTANELTLSNAHINVADDHAILINNENLSPNNSFKINLAGKNDITSAAADRDAILINPLGVSSAIISSSEYGTLNVTGASGTAVLSSSKILSINNCNVNIQNTHATAPALKADNNALYLNYANVTAESAGTDAITEINWIEYRGCFMTTPSDGFVSAAHKIASKGSTNKYVVVIGTDNIKPNFYYGDTPSVGSLTHNSVIINFSRAMDNLTDHTDLKYHVMVAKADDPETWVKDYDLNISVTSSKLQTEVTDLEPETKYIFRMRVTDKAGNYDYYKDLEFTTPSDPTAINTIMTNGADTKMYNAAGMQVNRNYRGMIISNGKKYSNK